jgi:hypothetical protein
VQAIPAPLTLPFSHLCSDGSCLDQVTTIVVIKSSYQKGWPQGLRKVRERKVADGNGAGHDGTIPNSLVNGRVKESLSRTFSGGLRASGPCAEQPEPNNLSVRPLSHIQQHSTYSTTKPATALSSSPCSPVPDETMPTYPPPVLSSHVQILRALFCLASFPCPRTMSPSQSHNDHAAATIFPPCHQFLSERLWSYLATFVCTYLCVTCPCVQRTPRSLVSHHT